MQFPTESAHARKEFVHSSGDFQAAKMMQYGRELVRRICSKTGRRDALPCPLD
jgi:hypothetical protein